MADLKTKKTDLSVDDYVGQIEDPDATTALCDRLWDDVPEVRKMAAWALGQIEDPDALNSLLHEMNDPVPDVLEGVI